MKGKKIVKESGPEVRIRVVVKEAVRWRPWSHKLQTLGETEDLEENLSFSK